MKNTLMVPMVFVLYFLFWTMVLSLFSVLGISTQIENFFSGAYKLFFTGLFFHGLYFVLISLVFSFVSTYLYVVRHPTLLFLTIPFVIILALVSVFFIIPVSYKGTLYTDTIARTKTDTIQHELPASNLVHQDSHNRLVWFTNEENPLSLGPLVVVNSESRQAYPVLSVFQEVTYLSTSRILSSQGIQRTRSLPRPDSQLVDMLKRPSFLDSLISDMNLMLEKIHQYWIQGRVTYVVNAGALFFLILSISSISYLTGWRLLNGILSFAALRLLFWGYPYLYQGSFYNRISGFLGSFLPSFILTPILCGLFSVFFLFIGLLSLLTHKTKKNRSENRYE